MTLLDTPLRKTVKTIIDLLGADATLTRNDDLIGTGYDPTTGVEPSTEDVEYSVKMTPPEPFSIKDVDGTLVKQEDLTTLLAAKGLAITPSKHTDKLTFNGTQYVIMGVDPIHSGQQVAAWQLHLRK